jgi:hypothetical protein
VRRYLAAGIWLLLTVTATLIVWEAVGVVAADVTDRPAPVVAYHQVVVALQAGSTSTTTTVPTGVTVPTVPSRSLPTGPAGRTPTAPSTTVAGGPSVVPIGPLFGSATTTTTTPPSSPPTTKAPSHPVATTTTTTPASSGTATYTTPGGVIAVDCTAFSTIRLVAALPFDSFQAVVVSGGPYFVEVNFIGPTANYPVYAACFFGQPFQFNQSTHTTSTGP